MALWFKKTITDMSRWTLLVLFGMTLFLFHEPADHVQAATHHDVTFSVKSDIHGEDWMMYAKIFLYESWDWSMKISEWDGEVHRITFGQYDQISDTYQMLVLAPGFKAYHVQNFQLPETEDPVVIDLVEKDEDYVEFDDSVFQQYIGEQLYSNYNGFPITKDAMQYVQTVDIYCGDEYGLQCGDRIYSIKGIEYATHLQEIRIDGQDITSIEPLAALTDLRNVQMENNLIESIEPLSSLPHLENIYMSNNRISGELPEFVSENLQSIYLNDNRITDFSNIANAPVLDWLDLSANDIQTLPAALNMPALHYLNLSFNMISDIDPLVSSAEQLGELRWLIMRNNFISDLSGMHELESLWQLDVSYNRITDIDFLEDMTDRYLYSLYLSGNAISDFSAIEVLAELIELFVEYMDLSSAEAMDSLNQVIQSEVMSGGSIYAYGSNFTEGALNILKQEAAIYEIEMHYFHPDDGDIDHEIVDRTLDWKVGESGVVTLKASTTGQMEEWDTYIQYLRIFKDGMLMRQNEVAVQYSHCELHPLKYAEYGVHCIGPVITSETEGFTGQEGVQTDIGLMFYEPGTYLIAYEIMPFPFYPNDHDGVGPVTRFLTLNVFDQTADPGDDGSGPVGEGNGIYIDTDPDEGKVSGYVFAELYHVPSDLDTSRYMFKLLTESAAVVSEFTDTFVSDPENELMIIHPIIGTIPAEAEYIGIYAERQQTGEQVLLMYIPLYDAKQPRDVGDSIRYMMLGHEEMVDLKTVMEYLHVDLTGTGEVNAYGLRLWLSAIDTVLMEWQP